MARVSFTIRDDLGQIVSRIETAVEHVNDFRPMWRRIGPAWEARGRDMFASQGRSTGTPWPSYDETSEREVYQFIKASILRQSLRTIQPLTWRPGQELLRPSLTNIRHPLALYTYGARRLEAGSLVPYAGAHDRGIGRAPEHLGGHVIPRRPLLGFGDTFVRAVAEASREHALSAEIKIDPRARRGRSIGLTSDEVNALRRGGA